jgi:hypothetical protein
MSAVIHALDQAARSVAGAVIAVLRFVWRGVTWPFDEFGRLSKQWKVFLTVSIAICLLTVGGLQIQSQVRTSVHWQYWTQVLTGNWSPQQPQQKPELPDSSVEQNYITDEEYLYGVVAAVVVNLSALVFLAKILWDVVKIKGRYLMNLNEAYEHRDIILKLFLASALEREPEKDVDLVIKTAFQEANKEWVDKYLAILVGKEEAAAILASLNKPVPS